MITLILADDHEVTRTGIKTIIELDSNIKVVKEVSNGKQLLDYLAECHEIPDALLLDLEMPVMDGPMIINTLHANYPTLKVIVFSYLYETDIVINMITKGASGFISKSEDPAKLSEAITDVYTNGYYLGELVKKEYFKINISSKNKEGFAGRHILSTREVDFIKYASTNAHPDKVIVVKPANSSFFIYLPYQIFSFECYTTLSNHLRLLYNRSIGRSCL